ncbi:hypothetical protein VTP01DRAFT_8747 [Rhizomucor pusillus]|uniref:uncharacterized protein n=1 Tax=Rhizomucor pusillus TaxID=4840 RepID=UPI0037441867
MPPKRSTRVTVIDSEIQSRSTTTRKTRVKRSKIKAETSVPAATADPSNGSSTKRTKRRKKAETAQTQAQPQARSSKTEMSLEQLLRSGNCTHLLSKDLLSRLNRARTQKMFVISRETTGTYTQCFQLLGSTGNVYTVVIGEQMSCDCHDYIFRRMHCKHILLVLMRVFSAPPISPAFKSTKISKAAALELFANSKPDPSVMVGPEIKELIDKKLNGEDTEIQGATQRSLDVDCPICFETFEESERPMIVFCKVCGNNIHKARACFDAWKSRCYDTVTCVYCRSEWVDNDDSAKRKKGEKKLSGANSNEGYNNFAIEAGLSLTRDTSTYGYRSRRYSRYDDDDEDELDYDYY